MQNVLGFVTARDHEARLLLEEITRRFASTSLSDRGRPAGNHGDTDDCANPSAPPLF